ncbi:uncharacterized protein [Spinacia oleracea]|uniref:RAP domain-containing protein n=1 Tax=Spinacia oleracea TaxID=3562 RepID=A0ABM3QWI0_SPIOL|nr:uncharacterized protein LOC110797455 [Spinacia oleracea]
MELQTCSFITMKFASSTMWLLSVRRSCTRHLQPFVAPVSNQNLGLFDALVNVLPLVEGDEEAQLKRITYLQAENDAVGKELQKQLEAAGWRVTVTLPKYSWTDVATH